MNIILEQAGKRFNREWIFRHLDYSFQQGKRYALVGPNGSGKSTLLQAIGGSIMLTEGKIRYEAGGTEVPPQDVYRNVSIAAPYLELVEEMTANEFLRFHAVFKEMVVPNDQILQIIGLSAAADKQIRNFSSGMKQRIKLAQAIFTKAPVLLLDEPCTNLDTAGVELYKNLIDRYSGGRLVLVASNDINEYSFCEERIDVMRYKFDPSVS